MIFDTLTVTSIVLYAALALITLASLPKMDRPQIPAIGCIVAGTLLAYCSANLPLFALGWAITLIPYWIFFKTGPRIILTVGLVALMVGIGTQSIPQVSFAALMVAALLRKGIFPFHSWVPRGFEESPLLPMGLLLNGHLGAILVLRFAVPMFPEIAAPSLSMLSDVALFTAIYAAVVAVAEQRPRRVLGWLSVSQAAFLLAGLENRNTEGVTGALVHWFVIAMATTTLLCVYRGLEARYPAVAKPGGYLGLVSYAPRMAAFFALAGLALVGLPGMLGFAAEDLLFHGSLESHPWLGVTLPLATALNAITVFRLFARLFLGRSAFATPKIADALPAERWAMTAAVMSLIVAGLMPGWLVALRTPAAEHLASLLSGR